MIVLEIYNMKAGHQDMIEEVTRLQRRIEGLELEIIKGNEVIELVRTSVSRLARELAVQTGQTAEKLRE